MNYQFTEMQLNNLKPKDLKKLATFYGIHYTKETPSSVIISTILTEQGINKNDPPMSVRVRRILEASRKGE